MMMDLKVAPEAGKPLKGTLVFEKAGTIEIDAKVQPIGARGTAAGADAGSHKH